MKQILAQNPEKIDNATQENRYGHRTNAQRKHAWPAEPGAKNVLGKKMKKNLAAKWQKTLSKTAKTPK